MCGFKISLRTVGSLAANCLVLTMIGWSMVSCKRESPPDTATASPLTTRPADVTETPTEIATLPIAPTSALPIATWTVHAPTEATTQVPQDKLNIPIAIALKKGVDLDFLNQRLLEHDFVYDRSDGQSLMSEVTTARKMVIVPASVSSEAENLIIWAKSLGVQIIGFNLEGSLTKEELVSQEEAMYNLVKGHSLDFMFGPTVRALKKYYPDFVVHTDYLVLQSQVYQTEANYREIVTDLIGKIKQVDPAMEVWVQVSVNPPGNRSISAEEVLENIYSIADQADGIFIFYNPRRWLIAQAVIYQLRP